MKIKKKKIKRLAEKYNNFYGMVVRIRCSNVSYLPFPRSYCS